MKDSKPGYPGATWATCFAGPGMLFWTLVVFVPLSLWLGNQQEFTFGFRELLPWLMVTAAAAAGAAAIALRASPPSCTVSLSVLSGAVGVLIWLQVMFLSADIGLLDGSKRNWNSGLATLSGALWVFGLLGGLRARRLLAPHLPWAAITLIAIQAAGLTATAAPHGPMLFRSRVAFDPADAFTYSSNGNIVVLVLDSARADLFEQALGEPAIQSVFDGFTAYQDTLGGYPTTYGAVPLILTGRYYDNSVPFRAYFERAAAQSLPARLREMGYRIEVYPLAPLPAISAIADNLRPAVVERRELLRLSLLSLLRSMPSPARIAAYERTRLFNSPLVVAGLRDGLAPLSEFEQQWRVVDGPPRFKYYHQFGLHLPFADEPLGNQPGTASLAGAHRQVRREIATMARWLERLRRDGLYDATMIVIAGDHGFERLPDERDAHDGDGGLPIPEATPLLMVKPVGARGLLRQSIVPATLADVAPTILAAVGGRDPEWQGTSLETLTPGQQRQRSFYYYQWDGDWTRPTLPPMREFLVVGSARVAMSWHVASRIFAPGTERAVQPYQWGSTAVAGRTGTLNQYLLSGWDASEADIAWTVAPTATLLIPVTPSPTGVLLSLDLIPFVTPDDLVAQEVHVLANGVSVGRWLVRAPGRQTVYVPPEAITGELCVTLRLPNAARPRDLGVSADQRLLGVAVTGMRLDPQAPPIANTTPSGGHGAAEPHGAGWAVEKGSSGAWRPRLVRAVRLGHRWSAARE